MTLAGSEEDGTGSFVHRSGLAVTVISVTLGVGLFLFDTPVPWPVRATGAATAILALLPLIAYLVREPQNRRPIPFLPIIGLLYSLYFAFPFAFGVPARAVDRFALDVDSELLLPALLALGGWVLLLGGYLILGRIWQPRSWDLSRFANPRELGLIATVLLVLGIGQEALQIAVDLPQTLGGLTVLVSMLGWIGAGFLVAIWARCGLRGWEKLMTVVGVTSISLIEISTGMVANPARFWLLLFVAAWIGQGRTLRLRWWIVGAVTVALLIMFRGAVGEYRSQTWYGADLTVPERLEVFVSTLYTRIDDEGLVDYLDNSVEDVESRSSYAAVLSDVVRRTPKDIPYWSGQTYTSLVGAFVPRFLWPSKPVKNLGQRFGHRYKYLNPTDQSTSFNLPWLVEFYANFGSLGVMVGMTVLGGLLSTIQGALNSRTTGFTGSILSLGLLTPVMTGVESDFSLVFGGLILYGGALFIVLYLMTGSRGRRYLIGGTGNTARLPTRRSS